jgi:hypothetical protein
MSSNRRHLLQLWAFPAFALLALSLVIIALLLKGKWWILACVALPVLFAFGIFWHTRRRVRLMFLNEKPDAMIDYLRSSMQRSTMPHAALISAANAAKHYAVWGEIDAALRELEPHDWLNVPDIYRSMGLQARALVHFVSRDDVAAGLADARRALKLSDVPNVPGKAMAREAAQTYVDLGEILNGVADEGLADRLRGRLAQSKLPMLTALLQWGLGMLYERAGSPDQAQAMRRALSVSTPHCKPLHDFSNAP